MHFSANLSFWEESTLCFFNSMFIGCWLILMRFFCIWASKRCDDDIKTCFKSYIMHCSQHSVWSCKYISPGQKGLDSGGHFSLVLPKHGLSLYLLYKNLALEDFHVNELQHPAYLVSFVKASLPCWLCFRFLYWFLATFFSRTFKGFIDLISSMVKIPREHSHTFSHC